MMLVEEFAYFMGEYLSERVEYRGGLHPATRIQNTIDRVDQRFYKRLRAADDKVTAAPGSASKIRTLQKVAKEGRTAGERGKFDKLRSMLKGGTYSNNYSDNQDSYTAADAKSSVISGVATPGIRRGRGHMNPQNIMHINPYSMDPVGPKAPPVRDY